MKITEILKKAKPSFSFEFFPPKTEEGLLSLYKTISELEKIGPAFISITYGAMGTTRKRTLELIEKIKKSLKCEIMAHLTCIGSSSEEILSIMSKLKKLDVSNILALRGDIPEGYPEKDKVKSDFLYAADLVRFIKKLDGFCIGVAGYPECHKDCRDIDTDINYLKEKIDAGADFIITQLFFHNEYYYSFVEKLRKRGIMNAVIPGIMPITGYNQISTIQKMCGCSIHKGIKAKLEKFKDDPVSIRNFGVDYATKQCGELLAQGAPGIHFYTFNRSEATRKIWNNLSGK
ncbi:MAG: methylenetetrahydrofolate reductase [NAD(P)H] [Candidatus Aureabacteria bacterium]|nr:methylenetetrahydrofolate reductase [NAD(P)H] [Candidatus Auribacterota bacterium]